MSGFIIYTHTQNKNMNDSIFSDSEDEEHPEKKHVDLIDLSERTDDEEEPISHRSKKHKTTCVSCGDDECKTPISYFIQCPCGDPHCPCDNGACDLGECDVCGYHTTCVCQRCGGDGSMEHEGCSCDCRVCNSDTNECFCDTKTPLPCGTVHTISRFQAIVRSYLVRKSFYLIKHFKNTPLYFLAFLGSWSKKYTHVYINTHIYTKRPSISCLSYIKT